jgi:tRNA(Leu) C34 or U34 (ribose-2'-O)-methylase TrmL
VALDRIQKIKKTFQRQKSINTLARPGVHDFVIVLDQLKPNFNVGKTIRSVEVFGGKEVYLIGIDFFNPYPSKGAFVHVPVKFISHFKSTYDSLRAQEYTMFALDPDATESLQRLPLPEKSAFIIGHEYKGLSFSLDEYPEVRKIKIDQFGHTQSLNACVAASVAMYEYTRQHPLAFISEKETRPPEISLKHVPSDDHLILERVMSRTPTYLKCVESDFIAAQANGDSQAILADGRTIGLINFQIHATPIQTARIHLLLLEERFQKQGFGRLAYQNFESSLKQQGVARISVGVNPALNVTRYWEKMGFLPTGKYGIEKGITKKYRVLQMEKIL